MKIRFNKNILYLIAILLTVSFGNYFMKELTKKRLEKLGLKDVKVDDAKVSIESIYTTIPNFSKCTKGVLKDTEIQEFIETINKIRILHDLRPVTYQYKDEYRASEVALIGATNYEKDGKPDTSYSCWSSSAPESLEESVQRYFIYVPTSEVTTDHEYFNKFMTTENLLEAIFNKEINEELGDLKRLIFLNPFVSELSFGRADGQPLELFTGKNGEEIKVAKISSIAIRIEKYEAKNLTKLDANYIAYPYKKYPSNFFQKNLRGKGYPFMSFSVIADKRKIGNNKKVDFSNAKIKILDEDGKFIEISSIDYNSKPYGIRNALIWKVDNLNLNSRYKVKIEDVKVIDEIKNYEYWFELI